MSDGQCQTTASVQLKASYRKVKPLGSETSVSCLHNEKGTKSEKDPRDPEWVSTNIRMTVSCSKLHIGLVYASDWLKTRFSLHNNLYILRSLYPWKVLIAELPRLVSLLCDVIGLGWEKRLGISSLGAPGKPPWVFSAMSLRLLPQLWVKRLPSEPWSERPLTP